MSCKKPVLFCELVSRVLPISQETTLPVSRELAELALEVLLDSHLVPSFLLLFILGADGITVFLKCVKYNRWWRLCGYAPPASSVTLVLCRQGTST